MVKAFGINNKRKAGSGKIQDGQGIDKWANSIHEQVTISEKIKTTNSKFCPINYVNLDKNNPRKLDISLATIKQIVKHHPCHDQIETATDADWIPDYLTKIQKEYALSNKALAETETIVRLAFSIKQPENLIHPITVWPDDSILFLATGQRRFFAHLFMNADVIEAKLLAGAPTDFELAKMQWDENNLNESLTVYDKLMNVSDIIDGAGGIDTISKSQLSMLIGKSKTEAHRYLCVLRHAKPELMLQLKTGSINNLTKAAALSMQKVSNVTSKTESTKPVLSVPKGTNLDSLSQLLTAAASSLNLSESIKSIDMSTTSGAKKAFNVLISQLSNSKEVK